jgi:hypothetical protein
MPQEPVVLVIEQHRRVSIWLADTEGFYSTIKMAVAPLVISVAANTNISASTWLSGSNSGSIRTSQSQHPLSKRAVEVTRAGCIERFDRIEVAGASCFATE